MSQANGRDVCLVFGAGDYYDSLAEPGCLESHGLVIAADGGADRARAAGLEPDLIVGDFDSISSPPQGADGGVIRLPAEKDDTDMQAALKLGWARSFRRFTILGGLGGRIDHSIANVACLCLLAQSGGHGVLVGDGLALTVIRDGRLDFPAWWPSPEDGRMVSVFSASDISREVSETGLKYGLERAELDQGMSCGSGVSNEFLDGHPARIEVGQGSLIVSYPLSAPRPSWHTSLEPAGNLGPLDTSPSARLNRIRPVEPPGDA